MHKHLGLQARPFTRLRHVMREHPRTARPCDPRPFRSVPPTQSARVMRSIVDVQAHAEWRSRSRSCLCPGHREHHRALLRACTTASSCLASQHRAGTTRRDQRIGRERLHNRARTHGMRREHKRRTQTQTPHDVRLQRIPTREGHAVLIGAQRKASPGLGAQCRCTIGFLRDRKRKRELNARKLVYCCLLHGLACKRRATSSASVECTPRVSARAFVSAKGAGADTSSHVPRHPARAARHKDMRRRPSRHHAHARCVRAPKRAAITRLALSFTSHAASTEARASLRSGAPRPRAQLCSHSCATSPTHRQRIALDRIALANLRLPASTSRHVGRKRAAPLPAR